MARRVLEGQQAAWPRAGAGEELVTARMQFFAHLALNTAILLLALLALLAL
ncbi:hypothetical protein SAMN05443665_1015139 [Actinomadura meyerae]|uniref:Uncharacterized protein n=1 Tax=Actinomadura meyerae TaxID=240840 RepID=A0A239JR70_9ACTN|nr:hypothetical protein [Actinomadura meyerae]SNT08320.1 hypothetical protein SAMN05443665_1015139 [Actinomadura meyerae]